MNVSGECSLLGSVSSQQKFEATDVRALNMSQLSDRPCYSTQVLSRLCYSSQISNRPCYSSQISVTAQCYSSILFRKQQENTSLRHEGTPTQRREEKRGPARRRKRTPGPLPPLYVCFFLCLGLPCVNWASQGCCSFYLRSSLQSSDLPLFYFHELFPSLSFRHRHSGLLFPILTTQQMLCRFLVFSSLLLFPVLLRYLDT